MEYIVYLNAVVSLITLGGTAWNGYTHQKIKRLLAELQLNMMREMNGRYVRVDRFEEFKEGLDKAR